MPRTWGLQRSVAPANEPVSAAELKGQIRILPDETCQEWELQRYISAATSQFELRTDMAVMRQTWVLDAPYLPDAIQLPHPPLVTVESVTYIDTDGNTQTVDSGTYQVITSSWPGILARKSDQPWPTDASKTLMFPWKITYTAGYATADEVPQNIRQAILMLAGYFYERRIAAEPNQLVECPHAFEAIVAQYRVFAP